MDEQESSTVVLDVKFQFVVYALYLVLPKRQVIARKATLLEIARIVMAIAVNKKSLTFQLHQNLDNPVCPLSLM